MDFREGRLGEAQVRLQNRQAWGFVPGFHSEVESHFRTSSPAAHTSATVASANKRYPSDAIKLIMPFPPAVFFSILLLFE